MNKAEKGVRAFGQHFAQAYEKDVDWTTRFRSGDDTAIEELICAACAEVGISRQEYEKGVLSDSRLAVLQQELITEVVLSDLNPGPDNSEARESSGARRPRDGET